MSVPAHWQRVLQAKSHTVRLWLNLSQHAPSAQPVSLPAAEPEIRFEICLNEKNQGPRLLSHTGGRPIKKFSREWLGSTTTTTATGHESEEGCRGAQQARYC